MDDVEVVDFAAARAATLAAWGTLCARWGLSDGERRELLPNGGGRVTADVGVRMRVLVEVGYRLRRDDVVELRDWLRRPMLLFGLDSPLDVMCGGMDDLLRFRGLVERGLGS